MDQEQRQRYSRQIQLPQVGEAGQERLTRSRVLVVGLGGLGSPVALYLAAAGVGHLVLSDYDQVDLSNLQRQIAHRHADIGRLKVDSARDAAQALNPQVSVTTCPYSLEADELLAQVQQADVVVDASDNFETRFTLNRVCVGTRTALVSGAAMRMEGQVAVFPNDRDDLPCYNCLYRDDGSAGETCAQIGVLAPLVGIIGCIQATETLKLLVGMGESLAGRILLLDALTMEWRSLKLPRDPHCPTCSER